MLEGRSAPLIMNYEMNSGFLAPDHWLRTEEGGGRNLGEACHIYDLFTYLVDSPVTAVRTSHVRSPDDTHGKNENFTATLSFDDGSIASLTYTTLGCAQYPKETMRVYCDESVLVLDDYLKLEVHGRSDRGLSTAKMEKGHFEEIRAFAKAVREGGDWPIPLWHQVQATRVANTVEQQVSGARSGESSERA